MANWYDKYQRIKFVDKGHGFDGCNCWGLVHLVYKTELGIELPTYENLYTDSKDRDSISALITDEKSKWFEPDKPKEFDVMLWNVGGMPFHVGLFLRKGFMLHCWQDVDVAIERFPSVKWPEKRILGFARYGST